MRHIWAIIALSLVISSIVLIALGIQIAMAMYLVLLAIFILMFFEVRTPWG
jgi:hypothetical protein